MRDDAATSARDARLADLSHSLLDWYRANRRALPWRNRGGAYQVLVSEVMLQQTRVETVIPYYRRFLEAFPDVAALARAEVDEVLAQWSGLGYYSRARRLHAAARAIAERGDFPRTAALLLELPGVGGYTAAAIASIAFGEAVPVVDGNVERVIARVIGLDADPSQGAAARRVRDAAGWLLDRAAPGDSNQALMELGAVVCVPRRPRCLVCPLQDGCAGRSSGRADELPVRAPRRGGVKERRVVAVARRAERFLLVRNPEDSALFAGVWEFPWSAQAPRLEDCEAALSRSYGGAWQLGALRGGARHGITFRSLELEVRDAEVSFASEAEPTAGAGAGPTARGDTVAEDGVAHDAGAGTVTDSGGDRRARSEWLSVEQIAAVPTTSMVRKVLACLGDGAGTAPLRERQRRRAR